MVADLIALDFASTRAIAQRAACVDDIWESLYPTIMMGNDLAMKAVWVAGAPFVDETCPTCPDMDSPTPPSRNEAASFPSAGRNLANFQKALMPLA